MDDDVLTALRKEWLQASPSTESTTRAHRAVRRDAEGVRPRSRRRLARPRLAFAAAAAVLAVSAGALAVTTPWDRDDAPLVPASRTAAERIVADPLLSQLPWIADVRTADSGPPRIQDVGDAPSLRFPAGVGYVEAFDRLFESLRSEGALPSEAILEEPLPLGKTIALPRNAREGVAIDLRSPRGFGIPAGVIPSGFAAPPGLSLEEEADWFRQASEQGLIVPLDAVIEPPPLEKCQILDPASPTSACPLR